MNKENVKKKLTNLLKFSTEDLEKLEVFHEELLIYNKKYMAQTHPRFCSAY